MYKRLQEANQKAQEIEKQLKSKHNDETEQLKQQVEEAKLKLALLEQQKTQADLKAQETESLHSQLQWVSMKVELLEQGERKLLLFRIFPIILTNFEQKIWNSFSI